MKKHILLFIWLLIPVSAVHAQKHNEYDSLKLLTFLKQEIIEDNGNPTYVANAALFLESTFYNDYPDDWETRPDWISQIVSDRVTWVPGGSELRLSVLQNFEPPSASTWALSGALDFAGCVYLTNVAYNGHRLSSVNLSGCTELTDVTLPSNLLSSANFEGCTKLASVDIENNKLLLSKILLPNPLPASLIVNSQMVDIDYSVDPVSDAIAITMDLSSESAVPGHPVEYTWTGNNESPEVLNPGVFQFSFADEKTNTLTCEISTAGGDPIQMSVSCTFEIVADKIQVTTSPPTTTGEVFFYLEKGNDAVLIDRAGIYSGSTYLSNDLPRGDYYVKIETPGYHTAYYDIMNRIVTHWQQATPILIYESGIQPLCNITLAEASQRYNQHDSTMLAAFMMQKAGTPDGAVSEFPNAKVLLSGFYTDDWANNPRWPEDVDGTEWVTSPSGMRLGKIEFFPSTSALTEYHVSGTLDLSNCDSLKEVISMDPHQLTGVNLSGCEKLESVFASKNKLRFANFAGCERLGEIDLSDNELLYSKITLPPTLPDILLLQRQKVYYLGYSADIIEGVKHISMNLKGENTTNHPATYDWGTNPPDLTPETGLFGFKFDQITVDTLACKMTSTAGFFSNMDVTCFYEITKSRIKASSDPQVTDGTGLVYLKKGATEFVLADVVNYIDGGYYSPSLPRGEYVVQFEAPDYLSTYYNAGGNVVTDPAAATPVAVNASRDYPLTIKLTEVPITGRIVITADPAVTNGVAYVFEIKEGDEIVLVDPVIYTDGAYYSKELPEGQYIVIFEAAGYLFTYYNTSGNEVINWKSASIITIADRVDYPVTVKLTALPTITNEEVIVSGQIRQTINGQRKPTALARPFKNATVLLHSPSLKSTDNMILVATTKPDEETGAYEFKGLPKGTYYVSIDMPGYQMTGNNLKVLASVSGEVYGKNNFVVDETTKTISSDPLTSTPSMDDAALTLYPNPVTDVLHISGLTGTYTVKITNVLGQPIVSTTGTSPELELNLGDKPSGLYIIRIEMSGKVITKKLMKK